MSNIRKLRQFGLTIEEAESVEAIVRSVPQEQQAVLRLAIVVGLRETNPGKPFQDFASRIVRNHGKEVVS